MARDFYAEAEEIAAALVADGLVDEAGSLRNVIASGATATEILMGMRWHLRNVDRANKTTNRDLERRVRELIAELDKVLS